MPTTRKGTEFEITEAGRPDSWVARVEWCTPDTYDEPSLDLVMEHLGGHDAAIAAGPENGTYSATVTVYANTLRKAIASALELVAGATGETLSGLEVLRAEIHDDRVLQPAVPELVGFAEIAEMLEVSRQRAAQLAREHADFPPAVVATKTGPLRTRAAVEDWASRWERKSGRPKIGTITLPDVSVEKGSPS